jgi:TonB family protein
MKSMVMVAFVLVAGGAWLNAQDTLGTAKELYASAAYEDALSALGRIDGGAAPELARQIDEYRAFCLFALGRTREAESVAESVIRRKPLAGLDAADTSPRLERMFADVRKRLLPSLIRDQFRTARSELDRKSFATAEPPLTDARQLIAEAERLGVKDDGLNDLGVLVDGFLQLIRSIGEQRASQPDAVVASAATSRPAAPPRPAIQPSAPQAQVAPAAAAAAVYTILDEGISPPVTIDQRVPGMPPEMKTIARSLKKTGVLDIVIDESGRVVDATMRQSLYSAFDALVIRSAGRWKYEPATKDGVPVRFTKTIVLVP